MPIAHAGHWLVNIAYFLPVVAFLAWLIVTQVRERRRSRGDSAAHYAQQGRPAQRGEGQ
jgi:hypothetical protein